VAANQLFTTIEHDEGPLSEIVPVQLIERSSVAGPRD
jgi:DNA-binding LacI/PurR family transcriptional regulator